MSDYPSQYPWGPHGPRVDGPSSVLPNPTIPDPPPTFQPFEPAIPTSATAAGPFPSGVGSPYTSSLPGWSPGKWMRNFAIAGGAIGCLGGIGLGVQMHLPAASLGIEVLRFGIAGAAVGAGIPPWFKAAGFAIRAALWFVLGAVLWGIASGVTGQTNWLTGLR